MGSVWLDCVALISLVLCCSALLQILWQNRRRQKQRALQLHRQELVEQHRVAALELLKKQQWVEAVAALDEALTVAGTFDSARQAELYYYKGYAWEQLQQPEQAIVSYAACQAAEAEQSELRYSPHAAFRQGYLLAQLERWEEAAELLRRAVAVAKRASLAELHLNALRILLGVYQARRDYVHAISCAQDGLQLARTMMNEPLMALIMDMMGDAYLALGQREEALSSYEQSLDLYRKWGYADAELMVKQDIGKLYQTCGEWDKALAWLNTCLWAEERSQNQHGQARLCYDIACLYISKGELEEATDYLQRSMALFRQVHDKAGVDQVGRTLMGLSILLHRRATAGQMTFRDIERGATKLKKGEE